MEYTCTICSDPLEKPTENPVCLPCGHAFHKKCCRTWINIANKCPLCLRRIAITEMNPLFLSSESTFKVNVKKENLKQRKELEETLFESRMANKYLQSELKRLRSNSEELSVSSKQQAKRLKESKKTYDDALKEIEGKAIELRGQKLELEKKEEKMKKREEEYQRYVKKQDAELASYKSKLTKAQERLNAQAIKAQDYKKRYLELKSIKSRR